MEFKVEAASHLRRKFLTAIMPSMIEQLGLTNSKKAVVVKYGKKTKYLDMPWELDAFARQEIILRRAIEG